MTHQTFAAELKQWRAEHGMSQEEAAEYLAVSKRTLEQWESGRFEPGTLGPIRKLLAAKRKRA